MSAIINSAATAAIPRWVNASTFTAAAASRAWEEATAEAEAGGGTEDEEGSIGEAARAADAAASESCVCWRSSWCGCWF